MKIIFKTTAIKHEYVADPTGFKWNWYTHNGKEIKRPAWTHYWYNGSHKYLFDIVNPPGFLKRYLSKNIVKRRHNTITPALRHKVSIKTTLTFIGIILGIAVSIKVLFFNG